MGPRFVGAEGPIGVRPISQLVIPPWRHGPPKDVVHQIGLHNLQIEIIVGDPADRRKSSIASWICSNACFILIAH
jgi:hypothetical protein